MLSMDEEQILLECDASACWPSWGTGVGCGGVGTGNREGSYRHLR